MMVYEEIPWTEEGRVLLLVFESLIKQYGGRLKLANEIEDGIIRSKVKKYKTSLSEVRKGIRYYTPNDEQFIIDNIDRPHRHISAKLGRSTGAITKKILAIKKQLNYGD